MANQRTECIVIDQSYSSIMQAMVSAIHQSKHYIYIENQFFISYVKTGSSISDVKNDVATAIYERIVRAHEAKEVFRVYILLPLLPAFEGDIAGDTGSGMRAIMYYQYQSISRGDQSLIVKLEQVSDQSEMSINVQLTNQRPVTSFTLPIIQMYIYQYQV